MPVCLKGQHACLFYFILLFLLIEELLRWNFNYWIAWASHAATHSYINLSNDQTQKVSD